MTDPRAERYNERYGDEHYKPNEGGFFEGNATDQLKPNFPIEHQGKLLKILRAGPLRLYPMPYKIVVLWRHPKEIEDSFGRFFDHPPNMKEIDDYWTMMASRTMKMREQNYMQVTNFWFRDVVSDPEKHFTILRKRGWPIDVQAASAIPDESMVRCKIENLDLAKAIGI